MFGFPDTLPPSRIGKLHRCRCGRWLMNLAQHVSCAAAPVASMASEPNNDLRRKGTTAPWRKPVSFRRKRSQSRTEVTLECGHVLVRFNCDIRAKPEQIRCRECAPVAEGDEG